MVNWNWCFLKKACRKRKIRNSHPFGIVDVFFRLSCYLSSHFLYLRPPNKEDLKLEKYISRNSIMRLGVFLVLVMLAWMYDSGQHETLQIPVPAETEDQAPLEHSVLYYCNPVTVLSYKLPVQKFSIRKFSEDHLNFRLMFHHTALAFHILKTESPCGYFDMAVRNLTSFRHYHFSSPDDQPPLG